MEGCICVRLSFDNGIRVLPLLFNPIAFIGKILRDVIVPEGSFGFLDRPNDTIKTESDTGGVYSPATELS